MRARIRRVRECISVEGKWFIIRDDVSLLL